MVEVLTLDSVANDSVRGAGTSPFRANLTVLQTPCDIITDFAIHHQVAFVRPENARDHVDSDLIMSAAILSLPSAPAFLSAGSDSRKRYHTLSVRDDI